MVAVCGTGCPSDVSFTTHGAYVLPASDLRVTIDASGVVPGGQDLTLEGSGQVRIEAGAEPQAGAASLAFSCPDAGDPCHQGRAGVAALERMLEDSGLAVASDAELTELNEAIALSRMGPKVEPKLEHIMTIEAWYREQDRARDSD